MHLFLCCPHCKTVNDCTKTGRRRLAVCSGCGKKFFVVGPLPEPDWEIPMKSFLDEGLKVIRPRNLSPQELTIWVCPWCGRNVGVRKDCPRCGCDLRIAAPIYAAGLAEGKPPVVAGSYCQQALNPMNLNVALCRLHRLHPGKVLAIGGTLELAARMKDEQPPFGVIEGIEPLPLPKSFRRRRAVYQRTGIFPPASFWEKVTDFFSKGV